MKATCWRGARKLKVENVPEPELVNPSDLIMRITATTICGSDLHIYAGLVPTMRRGDIIGHEPVGEVVAVGSAVQKHKVGDRIVVSSIIGCGQCDYCRNEEYSLCDNSNPNSWMMEKVYTYGTGGIFGYSHMFGGYAGAQAQYLRVPFADVVAFALPENISDEQAICICDAWPTGYMGADLCHMQGGETVAVWGAGPVGLLAMRSAWLLGAGRVIAIDHVPYRLEMAKRHVNAEPLDFTDAHLIESLREMTAGRGPDCCIDACGMESHGGTKLTNAYDHAKQAVRLETDRPHVLRQMIEACRKGGTLVIMGVYTMAVDKFPIGVAMNKGLHFHMGQMHGPKYIPRLIELTTSGKVDPSFVVTHRLDLEDIPDGYEMFRNKDDECVKVLVRP